MNEEVHRKVSCQTCNISWGGSICDRMDGDRAEL